MEPPPPFPGHSDSPMTTKLMTYPSSLLSPYRGPCPPGFFIRLPLAEATKGGPVVFVTA